MRKVVDKLNTPLPVLLDVKSEVTAAYKGFALPTIYLLDQQQKVYGVWVGPLETQQDDLLRSVNFLLQ